MFWIRIVRRWDHLNVIIRFNHQNGRIRETVVDGQTKIYSDDDQPTIQAYLSELGEEGWDLVGIVGTETYLFSRLVNSEKGRSG
jgi:hypothetical protein